MPIDELHDPNWKNNERTYLNGYQNIYRFEIRITAEATNEIKDFTIDLLKTTSGLMSILKLVTRNYFQAFWYEFDNPSRCKKIELLPFDQFHIVPLEKIELKARGDIYKAKLSINKNIKQLYLGLLSPDNASVYEMILFDVRTFDLQFWFSQKAPEWQKEYSAMNRDKAHTAQIDELLADLLNMLPVEVN